MLYSHVIDDALEEKIGKAGLPRAVLDRELANLRPALDKLRAWHSDNTLPLLRLPARSDDLAALKPHAAVEESKVVTRQYLSQRRRS
jgi:glucose-6-phosphate isomerase